MDQFLKLFLDTRFKSIPPNTIFITLGVSKIIFFHETFGRPHSTGPYLSLQFLNLNQKIIFCLRKSSRLILQLPNSHTKSLFSFLPPCHLLFQIFNKICLFLQLQGHIFLIPLQLPTILPNILFYLCEIELNFRVFLTEDTLSRGDGLGLELFSQKLDLLI